MSNALNTLYETVEGRKENPVENSYTCYLFQQGIDKILKKCGEEMSEVIIAAKSYHSDKTDELKSDLENEICDVLYHITVLMSNEGIDLADIEKILEERSMKIGNKKNFKQVDHNS